MTILLLLIAAFVGACLFALRSYFDKGKERSFEERFVVVATGILVVLTVMQLSLSVIRMPDRDWNAARLTPSVAWTMGYDVYYPADEGPILNTLYGPGTVLTFLPAALANDPSSAVLITGLINVGAMSIPLLILLLLLRSQSGTIRIGCCAG